MAFVIIPKSLNLLNLNFGDILTHGFTDIKQLVFNIKKKVKFL